MAQTQIFRGVQRDIVRTAEGTAYCYRNTAVVTRLNDGGIRLNSGGWRTNTTKTAMNQASNQDGLGFKVIQKNYDWFVEFDGEVLEFFDGMVLR